jgi:subtilase family serine protease
MNTHIRYPGGGRWFGVKCFAAAAAAGLFTALQSQAAMTGTQQLHEHVPSVVAHLQAVSRLPTTNTLHLAIGLAPRNRAALEKLLQDQQDPKSPSYHQWLTLEQFTEQFGPTEQDYQKVIDFALANGLKVTGRHPNRLILDVDGAVSDVENALHTTVRTYRHPTEQRQFFAPDAEPSLNLEVPLLNITGLDNYTLPHHNSHLNSTQPVPSGASGADGYGGADLRNAYVPGTTLNGAGQSVGLFQFKGRTSTGADDGGGYFTSDLTHYESEFGLPNISVTTVPVDGGFTTTVGDANGECSLDIEMVMAMAPGASIYVFESDGNCNDILSTMASYTFIKQFSSSWGGGVGNPNPAGDVILMQMAAQGQSFFVASGDYDAYGTGVVTNPSDSSNKPGPMLFPYDSLYLTSVGGTTLTMNGTGASYASETVWNDGTKNNNGGNWGSSGGISPNFAIPSWQTGAPTTANHGSTTSRNIPDVAMVGNGLDVWYNNGSEGGFEGTSCAAPLWAGFMALANQLAQEAGNPSAGFINPFIYSLYAGNDPKTSYANGFHDTTTGNNEWAGSTTNYPAVTGYDLSTGLGSPQVNLLKALSGTDYPTVWANDPSGSVGNAGTYPSPWTVSLALSVMASQNGTIVLENGSSTPGARTIAFPVKLHAVNGTAKIGP